MVVASSMIARKSVCAALSMILMLSSSLSSPSLSSSSSSCLSSSSMLLSVDGQIIHSRLSRIGSLIEDEDEDDIDDRNSTRSVYESEKSRSIAAAAAVPLTKVSSPSVTASPAIGKAPTPSTPTSSTPTASPQHSLPSVTSVTSTPSTPSVTSTPSSSSTPSPSSSSSSAPIKLSPLPLPASPPHIVDSHPIHDDDDSIVTPLSSPVFAGSAIDRLRRRRSSSDVAASKDATVLKGRAIGVKGIAGTSPRFAQHTTSASGNSTSGADDGYFATMVDAIIDPHTPLVVPTTTNALGVLMMVLIPFLILMGAFLGYSCFAYQRLMESSGDYANARAINHEARNRSKGKDGDVVSTSSSAKYDSRDADIEAKKRKSKIEADTKANVIAATLAAAARANDADIVSEIARKKNQSHNGTTSSASKKEETEWEVFDDDEDL